MGSEMCIRDRVWIAGYVVELPWSSEPTLTGRSRALTMPLVTVASRPNGDPMATTLSPTPRLADLPIVDQMASGETPTHARLGIQVGDAQTGDAAGAVVREVTSGSAADKAGLGSGSVITKVDDHRITGADSLVATIRSYRPGDSVSVTWTSGGEEQSADLVLDSDATQG